MRRLLYRYQHLAFRLAFEKDLVEWKPDIIHCNDWQTLSLGSVAKEKTNAKLVFDSHELETHRNPPLSKARKRWIRKYEREHFAKCDVITTVCEPISKYLSREYDMGKPLVIENAPLGPTAALPDPFSRWGRIPGKETLRRYCRFEDDDLVLVVVGNATINRGIETTIDALAMLPQNVKLAILGNATKRFTQRLRKQISMLALEDRVCLVEPVHPQTVVDYVSTADIGVIPLIPMTLSYEFALPNKFFECAFAGLPIVASDTFEVKRMIEKHELGTTFLAGDARDLARVLLEYLQRYKRTGSLKQDNREFVTSYAFGKSVGKLFSALEKL